MTIDDIRNMFPDLHWENDPGRPYPLRCHIGAVETTITEDLSHGSPLYTVTWTDGPHKFCLRAPNAVIARVNAEVHARMLFLKTACPEKRTPKRGSRK